MSFTRSSFWILLTITPSDTSNISVSLYIGVTGRKELDGDFLPRILFISVIRQLVGTSISPAKVSAWISAYLLISSSIFSWKVKA